MIKDQEMYTISKLKKLGFNNKLISELLPNPLLKPNPYYKCAPEMKLWNKSIVEEAMKSDLFKEYILKRQNYVIGAKKSILTKREKLMKEVKKKTLQIRVIVISKKMLRNDAIYNGMQKCYDDDLDEYYYHYPSEEVIQRWMVNYVRHNLTAYDEELFEMKGRVGIREAYVFYKRKVLEAIANVYPYLKEEVERQIEKIPT